ncbi:RlpA-like double-psi beta-barrel domain-containing protein [Rhodotorula paludigena]|uniref:RlpA-like double-psi beta-barrel domain-containing protein n=1 Tax=Rhodotorula paludigena TaxID=86838 RepID=UPI0031724D40
MRSSAQVALAALALAPSCALAALAPHGHAAHHGLAKRSHAHAHGTRMQRRVRRHASRASTSLSLDPLPPFSRLVLPALRARASDDESAASKKYDSIAIWWAEAGWVDTCGETVTDDAMIMGLPRAVYPDVEHASPLCGTTVSVTAPSTGKSITARVVGASDRDDYTTFSRGAFTALGGDLITGMLDIEFTVSGSEEAAEIVESASSSKAAVSSANKAAASSSSAAPAATSSAADVASPVSAIKAAAVATSSEEAAATPTTTEAPRATTTTTQAPRQTTTTTTTSSWDSESYYSSSSASAAAAAEASQEAQRDEEYRLNAQATSSSAAAAAKASADAAWASSSSASAAAAASSKSAADAAWASSSSAAAAAAQATKEASSDSDSSSSGGGSGKVYSGGIATYFFQNGNPGNCGNYNSDSTLLVALPTNTYAGGSHCGQSVRITKVDTGKQITAKVQDSCPTCRNDQSLDLSWGAFSALGGTESMGIFDITWQFV